MTHLKVSGLSDLSSFAIFNYTQDNPVNPEMVTGEAEEKSKGFISILVVDDDLIFGKNFAAILRNKGYYVKFVRSGNGAIAQLDVSHFDIVFLDIRLPDINGVEVFKKIKEIGSKAKVIIMSAFPFDKSLIELAQEGVVKYFCKPFDINEALRVIEEMGG